MTIVLPSLRSVQRYLDCYPKLLKTAPRHCPACGEKALVGHGSYRRRVWLLSGELGIPIRRLRCRACGRTTSLLPAFLTPRSRFGVEVRAKATALNSSGASVARAGSRLASGGCVVSLSTLQRWRGAA